MIRFWHIVDGSPVEFSMNDGETIRVGNDFLTFEDNILTINRPDFTAEATADNLSKDYHKEFDIYLPRWEIPLDIANHDWDAHFTTGELLIRVNDVEDYWFDWKNINDVNIWKNLDSERLLIDGDIQIEWDGYDGKINQDGKILYNLRILNQDEYQAGLADHEEQMRLLNEEIIKLRDTLSNLPPDDCGGFKRSVDRGLIYN